MRIRLHRAAQKELREAAQWYDGERSGLGDEFLDAVRDTLDRIAEGPQRFPVIHEDVRCALVPRFPYQIFYASEPDRLDVFAVFHSSRHPDAWKGRRPWR